MRRIATNVAIDELNAAGRRGWAPPEDVGHLENAGRVPASALASRAGPADPDLANQIRRAFTTLPPRLRVVATLALIEELPLAEIADALDIPVGTVKSRLFRATRELRTELSRLGLNT